ncbi:MAG: helix-turn-helix domain-containing protein [Chitinophagales bacterium]
MINKFQPELNKAYLINKYTMFHILKGSGGIEVDFRSYHDWMDKLIFLEKGQYIRFLSENFVVRKIEFEDENLFRSKDVRVLFKHLVALGYINFKECETCQKYLNSSIFSQQASDIIDISSKQWYWQNPFHANQEEYHIIFDIKDVIDQEYKNHLSNEKISKIIGAQGYDAQALFKSKIGLSVKSMLRQKRFLESKKEVAFTDKSIKEIAYEYGFKDPAYFNRVFSKIAGKSPNKFREGVSFESRDTFLPELYQLLETHHKEQRVIDFYANKMNLSIKTLSKKVKDKLNITLGQLIRHELINTAKFLLQTDIMIKEIAYELGFEEANHFSSFFKHHTSFSPLEYRQFL